ncbi:hypothetical protein [Pseudoalteromonas piratica]|uniref:Uncharacterized protein n=1 Tax=Pseudoalteromonas piratica TaxID=1348114 RepID=A0A0A7EGW0_9GAMM|nr:hypothetical protein [Pseudoalteromonas piratica]AIY65207.1 hypothetical protein OM33_08565 [Pseudoalteromonas piratica]
MSYRYLINNVALYAATPANNVIETFKSQIGGSWHGVCHDESDTEQSKGVRVFSHYTGHIADFDSLNDNALLDVRYKASEDSTDNQAEMIKAVFPVLDADALTIVRLTSVELDLLYVHPIWRLWCFKFDDEPSAEIAYKKVFGDNASLDGRKPMSDLKQQVRADIKAMFNYVSA